MKKQLIGTALGLVLGLGIGVTHTADAAGQRVEKPAKWKPTKVKCRGNGKDGYRQCGMHVYGKVDKVVWDLWINGEYHTGIIYEPYPEDVADAPGAPTVDSGLTRHVLR